MAKKANPKREARVAKNNRNLNLAMSIFTVGFILECYLLLVHSFLVKGNLDQVVAAAEFLEVAVYIGLAVFAAGLALTFLKKKDGTSYAPWNHILLLAGAFFTVSSKLMITIHPVGTTIQCVLVPVVTLMGVVYLLYQREFSLEMTALAVAIGFATLLNRSISTAWIASVVRVGAIIAALGLALVLAVLMKVQKADGKYNFKGQEITLFPAKANYTLMYAVVAFSFAALAAALFAGFAYYVIWLGAVLLFGLAVYYTVKMM